MSAENRLLKAVFKPCLALIAGLFLSCSFFSAASANVCFLPEGSGNCETSGNIECNGALFDTPPAHRVCDKVSNTDGTSNYCCYNCENGYHLNAQNGTCNCTGNDCPSPKSECPAGYYESCPPSPTSNLTEKGESITQNGKTCYKCVKPAVPECSDGYSTSCPENMISIDTETLSNNTVCYKCKCNPTIYKYDGYTADGCNEKCGKLSDTCEDSYGTHYKTCSLDSSKGYTVTNPTQTRCYSYDSCTLNGTSYHKETGTETDYYKNQCASYKNNGSYILKTISTTDAAWQHKINTNWKGWTVSISPACTNDCIGSYYKATCSGNICNSTNECVICDDNETYNSETCECESAPEPQEDPCPDDTHTCPWNGYNDLDDWAKHNLDEEAAYEDQCLANYEFDYGIQTVSTSNGESVQCCVTLKGGCSDRSANVKIKVGWGTVTAGSDDSDCPNGVDTEELNYINPDIKNDIDNNEFWDWMHDNHSYIEYELYNSIENDHHGEFTCYTCKCPHLPKHYEPSKPYTGETFENCNFNCPMNECADDEFCVDTGCKDAWKKDFTNIYADVDYYYELTSRLCGENNLRCDYRGQCTNKCDDNPDNNECRNKTSAKCEGNAKEYCFFNTSSTDDAEKQRKALCEGYCKKTLRQVCDVNSYDGNKPDSYLCNNEHGQGLYNETSLNEYGDKTFRELFLSEPGRLTEFAQEACGWHYEMYDYVCGNKTVAEACQVAEMIYRYEDENDEAAQNFDEQYPDNEYCSKCEKSTTHCPDGYNGPLTDDPTDSETVCGTNKVIDDVVKIYYQATSEDEPKLKYCYKCRGSTECKSGYTRSDNNMSLLEARLACINDDLKKLYDYYELSIAGPVCYLCKRPKCCANYHTVTDPDDIQTIEERNDDGYDKWSAFNSKFLDCGVFKDSGMHNCDIFKTDKGLYCNRENDSISDASSISASYYGYDSFCGKCDQCYEYLHFSLGAINRNYYIPRKDAPNWCAFGEAAGFDGGDNICLPILLDYSLYNGESMVSDLISTCDLHGNPDLPSSHLNYVVRDFYMPNEDEYYDCSLPWSKSATGYGDNSNMIGMRKCASGCLNKRKEILNDLHILDYRPYVVKKFIDHSV